MKVEKLMPAFFGIGILFTLAVVLPLLAVLVIVLAFFDLERGYL